VFLKKLVLASDTHSFLPSRENENCNGNQLGGLLSQNVQYAMVARDGIDAPHRAQKRPTLGTPLEPPAAEPFQELRGFFSVLQLSLDACIQTARF
jgi:hypothetical protein